MINIQGKLDRKISVACSGGVDSMAVVDFLSRNHNIDLMFFDHGTETSADARQFLTEFVENRNRQFKRLPRATTMTLTVGEIQRQKNKRESQEEYWRNQRYEFFHGFEDRQIITCHHLDDCVETWIFSSFHGEGKIIPYSNMNVIRPFRMNRKTEFVNWCRRNSVPWIEDESNEDVKYMRNFIRHELMPKVLVINPGIHRVVSRKVAEDEPKTS